MQASVKQHKAKPLFQSEAKCKPIDMEKFFGTWPCFERESFGKTEMNYWIDYAGDWLIASLVKCLQRLRQKLAGRVTSSIQLRREIFPNESCSKGVNQ